MVRLIRRRRFLIDALASAVVFPVALSNARGAVADLHKPLAAEDVATEAETVVAEDEAVVDAPVEAAWYGFTPTALAIPKLGVDARVVGVAQDDDGAMAAPADPDEVAWYTLGPGMGLGGNVVFAAHVDWGGRPRVFGQLTTLVPGDAVLVVDEAGNGYQYVVESSRSVRADGAPVEEIFGQTPDPTITLITCGGAYNAATREYLDRLIVRARGSAG